MAREEKREEQKNTGSTVQDKPGPDVELSQTSAVSENTDKTPSVSVSVEQGEPKSSEIQQDIKGMETGSSTFEVEVPFENRPSDAQQTTAGPDVSGMSQVWDTPVASKHSKRVTTALFVGLCVSAFVHGGSFNFRGAHPVDLSIRLAAHLGLRCLLSLVLSHFCLVEGVGLFASRTYILFHAAAMPAGILMK